MKEMQLVKLRLLKNVAFISTINCLSKLTTIVTGIILARLLSPSDFGIYGLAMSVMAFVLIFDEMGLKSAVIQKKTEYDEAIFYTGFFTKSAISIGLFFTIVFFVAPWSAHFYEKPDIKNITIFLSIIMLINNFKFIPETRIIKSNNLDKLLFPSVLKDISYSVIVILLAFWGFRYWSFVYANLLASILSAVAFFIVMPWKPRFLFNKQIGKELLKFGKFLLLGGLLSMVIKQMDNLIVGKLLGLTALGFYTMAYRWGSMFPLDIGKIVNQVLFPLNVKYQNDLSLLEKIQTRSLKYVSLVVFPISFGFFAVCPEFVKAVLGEEWIPAVVPLQIFSVHGLFWALMKRGQIFVALGKPKFSTFFALIFIPILTVLIFPLTHKMGIIGTAIAVLITFIIVNFILQWFCLAKFYQFNLSTLFSKFIIPFVSSIIMVAFIYIIKNYLYNSGYSQLTILILSVITGITIYLFCIVLLLGNELKQIVNILLKPRIPVNEKLTKIILAL